MFTFIRHSFLSAATIRSVWQTAGASMRPLVGERSATTDIPQAPGTDSKTLPRFVFSSLRFHRFRRALPTSLLMLLTGWGFSATALWAQSGPRPGAVDPIGNHLMLFRDDALVSFSPDAPNAGTNLRFYRTDGDTKLSLANVAGFGSWSGFPLNPWNPISAAAGRVLAADRDSVVEARRSPGTNQLEVRVFDSASNYILWTGGDPMADRTATNSIDMIAVAAGDLDHAVDSDHNYHEEVAVAYPVQGSSGLNLRLGVLNYTSHTSGQEKFAYVDVPAPVFSGLRPYDNPLAVTIGDFDGDGSNEIALAFQTSDSNFTNSGVFVWIYRYVSDGAQSGTLKQVSSTLVPVPFYPHYLNGGMYASLTVAKGDFGGKGSDQLALGFPIVLLASGSSGSRGGVTLPQVAILSFDSQLQPRTPTTLANLLTPIAPSDPSDNSMSGAKVQVVAGQFVFDPVTTPFGRSQLAVAANDSYRNAINIQAYMINDNYAASPIDGGLSAKPAAAWPGTVTQQYSLVAGGFTGNSNPNSPTQSLAVSAWTSCGIDQGVYWIQTIATSPSGLSFADLRSYATGPVDSLQRLPLVAADLDGKSVYLGAPAHITLENVISADYILEEPPKHSYWDNNAKQTVTVSNYDSNNTSFSYASGATSSSKSTDHSNWTIGGSVAASAGASVSLDEDVGIAKTENQASVDVTAKGSYEYNKNKESYNSQYGSRTFTIAAQTDHDDYLQGRLQTIDVWRYRIYGLTQTSTNNFYDIMLPGPTIPFAEGGLNFDWYQPVHENGNILTYPQKFNWRDTTNNYPADLGSYKDFDGTLKNESLIPIQQFAFDGTSGSEKLDLSTARGSGKSVDYSNTLAESLDVKTSVSAEAEVLGMDGKVTASAEVEFHNSNSWGSATTSDNTTTTDMTIAVNKSSGDASQAYPFEPAVYTTQTGTFKMSYAVPNPGSPSNSAGAGFWNGLYGGKPDPALNLPFRFSPTFSSNNVQNGWAPNLLPNRKQMRGLFFRKATANPITNDFDFLRNAATDGDQVRIEARIYNESTSQAAAGVTASFYTIPYNSSTNSETCSTPLNGSPDDTTNLLCPASARTLIGTVPVPALQPLQYTCLSGTDDPAMANCAPSVFINWNTKGFGPSTGTNTYRVYVVLTPDASNGELYGSDGLPLQIQKVVGGSPVTLVTAQNHNLHSGDWVTVGQSAAYPGINNTYQITWVSPNSFSLNNSRAGSGSNYAAGGTVTLLNPGQNDEGFGTFEVQSAGQLQGTPNRQFDDTLHKDSVRALDLRTNQLTPVSVVAYQNRPLQVRVTVFSSDQHPLGARLLLFDGDPDQGAPAIADQLVHPGSNGANGTYVWFTWIPRTTGVHRLYAKLMASQDSTKLGNKTASMQVNVLTPGDVNGDGKVDSADLAELQSNLGKTVAASSCGPAGDLDGDGLITVLDLRRLVLTCGVNCAKQ